MFGKTDSQIPTQKKVANIDENQVATQQQAVALRYVIGRTRSSLNFIAPVYNQKTTKITAQTGKDESSTVGYVYYGDIAGIFCVVGRRVPLAKLYKIIVDSQVSADYGAGLSIGNPYSPITLADYGSGRIYGGRMDQPADTLVLTPISTTLPPGVDRRRTSTWPNGDETAHLP